MSNNTLEFFVKMRDLMSGGLAKLAQNSQNTFTKMKGNIASAHDSTKFLNNSIDELRMKLKQVNEVRFGTVMKSEFRTASGEARSLDRQISRLEGRGSGSRFFSGRGLLSMATNYLGPVAMAAGLMSFGTHSVKAAMDFQAQTKSYQVLTGSNSIGKQLANQLRELKQDTIMGVSVYSNAQRMLSFGINSNKIIPDLKMMGDVSMGDPQKLKRITTAFSETESQGRLTGRRLLQFVNAGFNPLLEISKKTGKSMAVLNKEMRKGAITSGMVEDAFKSATSQGGRFDHMMDKMATTTYGKLLLLKGQWANFKIIIGEQLIPVATKLLDWAREILVWIEKNGSAVWNWIKAIGSAVIIFKTISIVLESYKGLMEGLATAEIAASNESGILTGGLISQKVQIGLLAAAIGGLVQLYNYLSDAMDRADANSKEFNQTAYDAEKNQLTNILSSYKGKGADKMKALFLNQTQSRLQDYVTQTQGEYNKTKAMELKHGIGGNLYENLEHSLQDKGVELSLYKSQLKAVQDLKNKGISLPSQKVAGGDDGKVASSIAGGGPRVINIHIGKMVERLQIYASGVAEGLDDMERRVEEHFLRILNSGASVQG